ncbi:MAG: 16S rRNA (cytosine(967)-C(5))-methyltransferase RsmB [Oscillospiraceae bacterium]|nr:16S rRNA (cytosine(967)-C(5))-methyltransferase RsmB [Oscillospiraceae bacterium]
MGSARKAALGALEKYRREGTFSEAALTVQLDAERLTGRDRAFATALVMGTLQNLLYLDFVIDCFSSTKSRKMQPKVLDILRVSALQIIKMDRVPPSAAVNEGVKLCKKSGCGHAAGLVNAVLRRIAERADSLPEPTGTAAERLSVKYSHPLWLTQLYISELGESAAETLMASQNAAPSVAMQVNTARTTAEALRAALVAAGAEVWADDNLDNCLYTPSAGPVTATAEFARGDFYIQDSAARLAVMAAEPKRGMKILDACAAPGGKSFAAALMAENAAEIISCDISAKKLPRIAEGAARLELDCISVRQADAAAFSPEWEGQFDIVLADVPCSGLGVIRKKPEIRYKDPAGFAALPQMQLNILRNVSRYVKAGGTLLYSTCTVRREENGGVIEAFLAENPRFAPREFDISGVYRLANGQLSLWPHIHGTDGFFIAKLVRERA